MKKIVAIVGIIIAVAAMVLLGLQLINPITFWIITGLVAVIAFVLLPKLK